MYVLVYTKTEEIHYCLEIKDDFNHITNEGKLDNQNYKPSKEISRISREHTTAHSSYDMYVCEQNLGFIQLINIIETKKDHWRLLTFQKGKPVELKIFK